MRMNLSEAISTWAMRRGDALAISGSRKLTYKELDELASVYAYHIISTLPSSQNKIAILVNDNIQFVACLLGIIRSGNIFVLINPNLSFEQINHSLKTIGCENYIDSQKNEMLQATHISIPTYNNDLFKTFHQKKQYNYLGIDDEAGVIFSSGTTGNPKALMRSNFSLLSETIQWMIELQLRIGTTFLIPRPLYYTGGFILMCASLFSGGRIDLLDDIDSISVLKYMQCEQVDWAFIVPSTIREINATQEYERMAKNVLTMGSPIYQSEKVEFQQKFNINLIEAWGNSEGLGTITEPSDLYEHPFSIGRPFFTDFLDVIPSTDSSLSNIEGLIFGKSDNEFSEYIGNPELTNSVLHNDYIFSEDVGYKDENGYFYLTGRVKEIIVIDGIKVFPNDIEKHLLDFDEISDCAVLGIPNKCGNELVSAAIVGKDKSSVEDVIVSINKILAPHERIKRFIVLDEIPRNHGGKVNKHKIIDCFYDKEG